jgi:type I restriction enzyme S subunit
MKGANVSRTLAVIAPDERATPAYLRYWLLSLNGSLPTCGSTRASLNIGAIRDLEIPLPPLAEQKRIVALLDEAFAGIDEAKAKAEDCASDVRELYRESVGSIFLRMSEKEPSCALGDVCGFVRGPFGGSLKKQHFVAKGYAVYEQQHAIYDQFSEIRYFVSESKYKEMKRFELSPGDLIMSCSGTMGRVAIVPDGIIPGIINQALLKLTPGEKIQAMFLKCWMERSSFQDALKKYAGGAAIQNVASVKILKAIMMPLPSAVEQANLVRSINGLREETERAAHVFEMKIESLKELKKSFLTQAFAGELTA